MDQHVTTEAPYYTTSQTVIPTPSSSTNLMFQPQEPQYHILQFSQPQASQPIQQQYMMSTTTFNNLEAQPIGHYPSIDFYYEQPQPQQHPQPQQQLHTDYTTIPQNSNQYHIPSVKCYTSCQIFFVINIRLTL